MSFVSADQVETAATDFGLDDETTQALVAEYSDAQLQALKTALLFAGFIVVAASSPRAPFQAVRLTRCLRPQASPR